MTHTYAQVIVDIVSGDLDRTFTYRIPGTMSEEIRIGSYVEIPFGKNERAIGGFVVGFSDTCDVPPEKIKMIGRILTDEETADSRLVTLAAWMAKQYSCNFIQTLHTVLPSRRKMKAKMTRKVFLAGDAEDYLDYCRRKHFSAKERVLSVLKAAGEAQTDAAGERFRGMDRTLLAKEAGVPQKVIDGLVKEGILSEEAHEVLRGMGSETGGSGGFTLTEQQSRALAEIREEFQGQGRPVLLYGSTGSGKTLLYMDLAEDALKEGRTAIVLIPEIALTYQTVRRFTERFGNTVAFLHSRLSEGEKYDLHKAARSGKVRIMVGPRSALFTPFSDLGLIVIDEEQEDTYRSESMPRYDARDTAVKRAQIEGARVVLGSATPSLVSYERGKKGIYRLVTLQGSYSGARRVTHLIDMRSELRSGNRSILSAPLRDSLEKILAEGHQAMLFLNRRGYAGFVSCRSCGTVIKCPHCDVSLTEHRDGKLRCHYCGFTRDALTVCPECGMSVIGGMKIGTEQVETQVREAFPGVRTLRMDRDTTGGKEGHTQILKAFSGKKADVLIGTQMIVKGHDFPNVALIGILAADLSLNDSDYRSAERTYALLAQAIGRTGRGEMQGEAFIQTYRPDHYAVVSAMKGDYEAFFEEEMAYRRLLAYPPGGEMLAVYGTSKEEAALVKAMDYLRKYISRIDPSGKLRTLGPAYLSVKKIRDRYRMGIYLRHTDHGMLMAAAERVEAYVGANRGFDGISIQFDYNV